jgi:hypothetical protein
MQLSILVSIIHPAIAYPNLLDKKIKLYILNNSFPRHQAAIA